MIAPLGREHRIRRPSHSFKELNRPAAIQRRATSTANTVSIIHRQHTNTSVKKNDRALIPEEEDIHHLPHRRHKEDSTMKLPSAQKMYPSSHSQQCPSRNTLRVQRIQQKKHQTQPNIYRHRYHHHAHRLSGPRKAEKDQQTFLPSTDTTRDREKYKKHKHQHHLSHERHTTLSTHTRD